MHKNKYELSCFVAFQIARTSSIQKNIEAMREYVVKNIGPDVYFGEDTKTVGEFDEKDDKQAALGHIINNTPKYTDALLTRAWYLCESPRNNNFIISDNPVTRDNMFDQSPYGNLGILSPGIELYLPLSPRYCLYIICPKLAAKITSQVFVGNQFLKSFKTGSPIIMTSDNVRRANSLQVEFAERFVFSKSKSDLDIAIEMISDNPKFKKGLRAKIG